MRRSEDFLNNGFQSFEEVNDSMWKTNPFSPEHTMESQSCFPHLITFIYLLQKAAPVDTRFPPSLHLSTWSCKAFRCYQQTAWLNRLQGFQMKSCRSAVCLAPSTFTYLVCTNNEHEQSTALVDSYTCNRIWNVIVLNTNKNAFLINFKKKKCSCLYAV